MSTIMLRKATKISINDSSGDIHKIEIPVTKDKLCKLKKYGEAGESGGVRYVHAKTNVMFIENRKNG